MLSLKQFFASYELPDLSFKDIHCDSRLIQEGDVFVAVTCDALVAHVRDAVQRGAVAIIMEEKEYHTHLNHLPERTYVFVPSARQAWSQAMVQLFPEQSHTCLAVTGTNGKTSVAYFVREIWKHLDIPAASMGTLGLQLPESMATEAYTSLTPQLTSFDPRSLHQILVKLAKDQINHVVFEASSHGLDQYRLHGVRVQAAAFTNLTQDHLDYHGTMDAYFSAKSRLFTQILDSKGTAVLNAESPYTPTLQALIANRKNTIIQYALTTPTDVYAAKIHIQNDGMCVDLKIHGELYADIPLQITGPFQIENLLAAISLITATGVPTAKVVACLPHLTNPKGRLERVGKKDNGAAIYVDYAHTPDALERALQALRSHVVGQGQLWVLFGCGGNRDVTKRAIMGKIAHDMADKSVITDDNPRWEDPAFIRAQILTTCPEATEIGDRYTAIQYAISQLQPDDLLMIAGKGHETGQWIRDQRVDFDDTEVVRSILHPTLQTLQGG